MKETILGLHHITAIASSAKGNLAFYENVLGLRLVKKTVNFDDPGTYHLYYGNEQGMPGTILTFFPWEGVQKGYNGTSMATEIGYSIPQGSLDFWIDRFKQFNTAVGEKAERFGEVYLPFTDPDGLNINLIVSKNIDERVPWETKEIKKENSTKGFHSVTLTLKSIEATAKILTDIFGYSLQSQEGNRYRFATDAVPAASIVDLVETPDGKHGYTAGGTNHHVAFRVANEAIQMNFHDKLASMGLHVTAKIDREYFFSVYFREPGGVLFEIATDNPGFTVDEPLAELGTHLKLPPQYEPSRAEIEKVLPVLK